MKADQIIKLVEGEVCGCQTNGNVDLAYGFSSDLMSDVLRFQMEDTLLITGLCNVQTIRTAEMADLPVILIGRDKQPDDEMVELATDSGITLIKSKFSVFRISAILYNEGLKPLY